MTIEPTWVYGRDEYERAKRAGKIQNGHYAGCRVYINLGPRKDDWKSIVLTAKEYEAQKPE